MDASGPARADRSPPGRGLIALRDRTTNLCRPRLGPARLALNRGGDRHHRPRPELRWMAAGGRWVDGRSDTARGALRSSGPRLGPVVGPWQRLTARFAAGLQAFSPSQDRLRAYRACGRLPARLRMSAVGLGEEDRKLCKREEGRLTRVIQEFRCQIFGRTRSPRAPVCDCGLCGSGRRSSAPAGMDFVMWVLG
jgi:hypothetical protein